MNKTISLSLGTLFLVGLIAGCGGGGSNGGSGTGNNSNNSNSSNDIAPASYKISGSVTSAGMALPGVTVTLSGLGTATAFTNSSGHYVFSGLANGNYKVTATKADFACRPKSAVYTIAGADIAGGSFTATASPPVFYVVDDTQLALLDVANKTITIVGNTGVFLNDIAFDPSGNLFGVSGHQLYSINPATAAATPLASPMGIVDTTPLVFSDSGTLYTANTSLCTVNPLTGMGAVIGAGGDAYQASGDLSFFGDQLFLTSAYNATTDSLVRLDAATGAGVQLGPIGFLAVYGLATNDDVTLYGFSGSKVIKIDTTTGAGSLVWDTNNLNGLGTINGAAFH